MPPEQRDLNRGFASTFNRGLEFAVTMALFGGLGWLLDRALGTGPVFVVVLMLVAVVGQTARLWYAYDAAMKQFEAGLPLSGRKEAPR